MDPGRFDRMTRSWRHAGPRRPVLGLLASGAAGIVALTGGAAKKRKKKKVKLCLNGQTLTVPKKKQRLYLSQGAIPGACPPTPPCDGTCAGKPCGADDGCGGTCGCPTGQLCQEGTCRECTVTCSGTPAQCGTALQEKLNLGGTIYACPGHYVGSFSLDVSVTLIGAGQGTNPATNTVLDANRAGRVAYVEENVTAVLENVRLTGGQRAAFGGGGVHNAGALSMTRCTVTGNTVTATSGGGLFQSTLATGPMTLSGCTISDNRSDLSGGGVMQLSAAHQVTMTNCTLSGNLAGLDGTGNGGGIACSSGVVQITGGSITRNSADSGGGIWASASDGDVALSNVTLSGNSQPQCVNVTGC